MSALRKIAAALLRPPFQAALRRMPCEVQEAYRVARRLRTRLVEAPDRYFVPSPAHTSSYQCCFGYRVRAFDPISYHQQYKDLFVKAIYFFHALRPDPLIIDGGSNWGMSILYFKHLYPESRVVGFEPDPSIFRTLQENIDRNQLSGVTLVNAGLDDHSGTASFTPDGADGGQLAEGGQDGLTVPVQRLSDYLDEPVDFLKLNIEGRELPVLREAAESGRLRKVREMVVEYHGIPAGDQRLGDLLNLLDRQGFRYMVHDWDEVTGAASKPPFRLTPRTVWSCLVYARQYGVSYRDGNSALASRCHDATALRRF